MNVHFTPTNHLTLIIISNYLAFYKTSSTTRFGKEDSMTTNIPIRHPLHHHRRRFHLATMQTYF